MAIKTLLRALEGLIEGFEDIDSGEFNLNILGGQTSLLEVLLLKTVTADLADATAAGVVVLVLQDVSEFPRWENFLALNLGDAVKVVSLPHINQWGRDRYARQRERQQDRLKALSALAQRDRNYVALATMAGLRQHTMTSYQWRHLSRTIHSGDEIDLDDLLLVLEDLGYVAVDTVTEPASYASRGGIVDIFSYHEDFPVRLDFIGDRISGIKHFDPNKQTSLSTRKSFVLSPAQEFDFGRIRRKEIAQALYEYSLKFPQVNKLERQGIVDSLLSGVRFPGHELFSDLWRDSAATSCPGNELAGVVVFFSGAIRQLEEEYKKALGLMHLSYQEDVNAGKLSMVPEAIFNKDLILDKSFRIEFGDALKAGCVPQSKKIALPIGSGLEEYLKLLRAKLDSQINVMILVHTDAQLKRVKSILNNHNLSYSDYRDNFINCLQAQRSGVIGLVYGDLTSPIFLEAYNTYLLPEHSMFGEKKRLRRSSKKSIDDLLSSFRDLTQGSLVVHVHHGIGRYIGMKSMEISGLKSEFLVLEYAAQDKVYLPVENLGLLQKYSGGTSPNPPLDKLRSQGWTTRKNRVRKAVKDIAKDLLSIHAKRKLLPGRTYSAPNDLYYQLEADFPFDETEDQVRCIDEVNEDLSSSYPMDRLVCGDVGFGKTEIAIRAAMRVVMDGYQVMILAPTTVLSYQHYTTFKKRFEKFGVSIGLLNRFMKSKVAKAMVADFNRGSIDLLIGTHRLLSKDVKPSNLGLIVVDEEQRFGVSHKEALKKIRASCDILTLTATPIPRSLHMAILGLKDISTIMTPPVARLGIQTFVMEWSDQVIGEGIRREIQRGGQVFFVHNRVSDILNMKSYITQLLPDIDVRVAHGQMREMELETVILDFLDQKFSVLLCTTIIESGIDMPNVNTIFVNQADRFGLAQLYQMRGRVGRSQRQSYAYFLVESQSTLSAEAEQRLDVLAAHQELGSGFQIASYDLEFRGAGDLLGGSQSGHVSDVGFELYTKMLEEEVRRLQGGDLDVSDYDPEIKIRMNAYLSEVYISSQSQRLTIYKRLFTCSSFLQIDDLEEETNDRFGSMPPEAQQIFAVARLKLTLRALRVKVIWEKDPSAYEIRFYSMTESLIHQITQAVSRKPDVFTLNPDYSLLVSFPARESQEKIQGLIASLSLLNLQGRSSEVLSGDG